MNHATVLVINCGSSSIKFALVDSSDGSRLVAGIGERLGSHEARIRWSRSGEADTTAMPHGDHRQAMERITSLLQEKAAAGVEKLVGIGHRVVHGGERFNRSTPIDQEVEERIDAVSHLAPLHNPANLLGIRTARALFPDLPQVAVFDTAFHQTLPEQAYLYAVPHTFYSEHGVRRYGFHGTSHRFVTGRAAQMLDRPLGEMHLLSAHLGNGCSATAVRGGRSVDTTMGLTPLEGLVMGTRSGDVDPSLHAYLARQLDIDLERVIEILNRESGLLGLSGLSNDMRTLEEAAAAGEPRARLAIEVFCYRLARGLSALTVALDRIDGLIFTGGIGENSALVRARTLEHLSIFGFDLDPARNQDNGAADGRITRDGGTVALVIPTDEEAMIARDTIELIEKS